MAGRPSILRNIAQAVRASSAAKMLVLAMVLVFILQRLDAQFWHRGFDRIFAITHEGLQKRWLWQFFTFQFLHGSSLHLAVNGLTLWSFGPVLEKGLGRGHFLKVYFGSALAGALLEAGLMLLFPGQFYGKVVGASAGIAGLMAMLARIAPQMEWSLFFLFPVRAKIVLGLSLGLSLLFTAWPQGGGPIAHAAHLGGMLAGLALLRPEWAEKIRTQLAAAEPPPAGNGPLAGREIMEKPVEKPARPH